MNTHATCYAPAPAFPNPSSRPRPGLLTIGATVAITLLAGPSAPAQSHTWTGANPNTDSWNQGYVDHVPLGQVGPEDEPSNWDVDDSPNGAPNTPGGPLDTVLIGGSPPTTMNVSAGIGSLTLNGPGLLNIAGGSALGIREGDLTNHSTLTVNSNGSSANAGIQFDGREATPFASSLLGTGTLVLNGATFSDATLTTAPGDSLTHAATHTIRGAGGLNVVMTNHGLIESAVSPSGFTTLELSSSPIANHHLLRATAGSRLEFSGATVVTNIDPTGEVIADGAGAAVRFSNATLAGGRIQTPNGGVVEVSAGGGTLGAVTNEGAIHVLAAHPLTVTGGGVINDGVITINWEGLNALGGELIFSDGNSGTGGAVVLQGSGQVVLNADNTTSTAQIESGDGGDSVVQTAGHTIRGAGIIPAVLVNNGVIESALSTTAFNALELRGGGKTNNHIIRATAGSEVRLAGGVTLTQNPTTGRLIADGAGAKVRLLNTNVVGGRIETINGGLVEVGLGSVLSDVVNQGTVALLGAFDLTIRGAGLENDGNIVINSNELNATTEIHFDDGASGATTGFVVDGGGVITLNAFNTVGDAQLATGTLDSLTQRAGHTIRGAGQITGTVLNQGLVESASSTNGFKTLSFATGSYGNSGTFRATNDTSFLMPSADTRLANYDALTDTLTAGRFEVIDGGAGATMSLTDAPINTNAATVVLEGPGSVFTQIDSLTSNQGTFVLRGGRDFTAAAGLTNTGTIELGAGSTLTVSGAFTQPGSTLRVGISGPDSDPANFGRVVATVTAAVAGRLEIAFNFPGATSGMTWDVVTAGSARTGTFSDVRIVGLPLGLSVATHYLANAVRLELVGAAASYPTWATGQGFASPAEALPDADANHNGLSNLTDYALGLNAATPGPGPVISNGKITEAGQEFLILVYRRPAGANKPTDILYVPRGSETLASWTGAGLTETVSDIDPDGWEKVTVRAPATARSRAFLRVEIVSPP